MTVSRARVRIVHTGYLLAVGLLVAGVYLLLGLPWALIAAGLGVGVYFLWLFDVTTIDKRPPVAPATALENWRNEP